MGMPRRYALIALAATFASAIASIAIEAPLLVASPAAKAWLTRIFVPVTAVKLSASSLALTEGDVARLTATVEPADATDKTVVWSSDNPAVASVDQTGFVTALAAGTAKITATTKSLFSYA